VPRVDDGAGGARVSTQAIAERVREAGARHTPLRIVGAGTWLDGLRLMPADAQPLSVASERGIVEYTPGDLTLTARAGTSLAEIAHATAAHGQWLTLDPHGSDDGTIGATVATASWGPLAHAFGTPRDLVLGLEAVTGDGTIIRTGGRVVKNVAGFDLTRLFTGSWGTLAVITEVTVRLRARPEAEETIAIAVRDDAPEPLAALLAQIRAANAAPMALELLSPAIAARLGAGASTVILARLGGNAESVRAQRAALAAVSSVTTLGDDIWRALRAAEPPQAWVQRLSGRPSRLPALWGTARDCCAKVSGAYAHATVSRGVVRLVFPDALKFKEVKDDALDFLGYVGIVERVGRAGEFGLKFPTFHSDLARRARAAFDPHRILNSEAA